KWQMSLTKLNRRSPQQRLMMRKWLRPRKPLVLFKKNTAQPWDGKVCGRKSLLITAEGNTLFTDIRDMMMFVLSLFLNRKLHFSVVTLTISHIPGTILTVPSGVYMMKMENQ